MGFLPHTNVGILSFTEMQQLKNVNVSMGLMLEQLTPALLHTVCHYPHGEEQALKAILQSAGWELLPRLPIYIYISPVLSLVDW